VALLSSLLPPPPLPLSSLLQVVLLLKTHKQFEGVIKKMGKSGLMKGGEAGMARQMMRNPNNVMQQLHKAIDPR